MQSAPRLARTALRSFAQAPGASSSFSSSSATGAPHSPSHSSRFSPYSLPSSSSSSSSLSSPSARQFPTSHLRSFSVSSSALAREAGGNPFEDPKFAEHAPLFSRIMDHPEVLEAIENMAKLTAEKTGVDLQNGGKPSMAMMLSLARDPDLRLAAERLMSSLRTAGIEIDPKQAFQALQMMGGEGFEGFKGGLGGLHEKVRGWGGGGKKGEGEGEGEGKQ
ncbi:hypothetical protein JCM8547_008822 [Rhodosporidiobolus lusitaniae]